MNWQGKWIWVSSHSQTPNFYMYARKEIEITGAPFAKAFITCSSQYKLYVNGRYVGCGPSPCHPSFQYYDEYDLSRYLRPGKNVIAAICYNYGVGTHFLPQSPGAFLMHAEIGNNSETLIIGTDETWKVKPADDWDFDSAQMFWTVGFQEVYDSRNKPVGWNVVGFDDSLWEESEIVGEVGIEPWTSLIPRQIPPLKETEVFPQSIIKCGTVERTNAPDLDIATLMYQEQKLISEDAIKHPNAMLKLYGGEATITVPDTFVVIDFGREVVGFPRLRIRDGGVGTIDIGYSETLDSNGNVIPVRQSILQADRLITHGGRQEWQTFHRRAFRYMQLTFKDYDSPVQIDSISIDQIGYPVEQVCTFECSDNLLNQIWQTGVYTLSIAMQDSYEDCPLREHGQYPGDVRVQALLNYYSFFDAKLAAKALWQFVQCQREDGLFNALWPSSTNHILPDYNLVWVMMLHDYLLYTNDQDLTEQLYSSLQLLLNNWLLTQESENGLLTCEPNPDMQKHEWWLFIDHAPIDKHGEVAAYNAFYYQALRDAAKIASALGRFTDMMEWHSRADIISKTFNERFWSDEKGAYIDCNIEGKMSGVVSIHANSLAILFGLANPERTSKVSDYFTSGKPFIQSSGPYFNFYVLQALVKIGLNNEALNLIRSCWGGMLKRGATTWWETFDPNWPQDEICPDSLCHAWSGAPTYFLPAEVLGVKPSMPNSSIVVIQPRIGDLEWAKGQIKTHSSEISVEWHSEPGLFKIDINAPDGFIVAIPIERFINPYIEEIDLSPETPERRARKTYGWNGVIWRNGEEHDPYLDWLASQEDKPPKTYSSRKRCSSDNDYIWVSESTLSHVRYEVRESP